MNKVAIVAPVHIQPSSEWVHALVETQKRDEADIILVDDSDGALDLPLIFDKYDYARQKECLGEKLYAMFERFHKSSACKAFGLWRAYQLGYETVIVIDSDCVIPEKFVAYHLDALQYGKGGGWANPLRGMDWYSRGYPYSKRDWSVVAHMGLWDETLDLYGTDRLERIAPNHMLEMERQTAPFFPLSGMNVSFKRDVIPYMFFLPNFTSYLGEKFSRHDDIFGGYIFQKIMQQKQKALSFGKPYVRHVSAVNASEDAEEEKAMIKYEDAFYNLIDHSIIFTGDGAKDRPAAEIFTWLAHEMDANAVFKDLGEPFHFWALAFQV